MMNFKFPQIRSKHSKRGLLCLLSAHIALFWAFTQVLGNPTYSGSEFENSYSRLHIFEVSGSDSLIHDTCEYLPLKSGINWISFPRLETVSGISTPQMILGGDKINCYDYFAGSTIRTRYTNAMMQSVFNGVMWPNDQLQGFYSRDGYKLELLYDPDRPCNENLLLKLTGTRAGPETSLAVDNNNFETWLGYFLPGSQHPLDAFPAEVLDVINIIKGQYWCCVKDDLKQPKGKTRAWQCNAWLGRAEMKYGDMVIVGHAEADRLFKWQSPGKTPIEKEVPVPGYFSFKELSNYTPVFVALDPSGDHRELGLFINDICLGATTVLPGENRVMIPAYLSGEWDEITFREYDPVKKTASPIDAYYVKNTRNGTWESRNIHTAERQAYYLVSLDKEVNEVPSYEKELDIRCIASQDTSVCKIEYSLQRGQYIRIGVYDAQEILKNLLQQGTSRAGNFSMKWHFKDSHGNNLPKGVYILKIEGEESYAQTKVVVM